MSVFRLWDVPFFMSAASLLSLVSVSAAAIISSRFSFSLSFSSPAFSASAGKKYDECYTPHKPASSVSVSLKSKGVALPYQLIKFPFLFWPDFSSLTSVSCFVVCFVSSLPSSCTFLSSVVAARLSVVSFFSSSFRSLSSLPSVFWPGDAFCDEES